jgi:hypothetical protein
MLRSIPSKVLKELVKLSERREAHLAQIQALDRQINRVQERFGIPCQETGDPAIISFSGDSMPRTRAKRGALKDRILTSLRHAGSKGATIRELSDELRVPSANLYVWFNGTGKNVRGLKKIGTARYRLRPH